MSQALSASNAVRHRLQRLNSCIRAMAVAERWPALMTRGGGGVGLQARTGEIIRSTEEGGLAFAFRARSVAALVVGGWLLATVDRRETSIIAGWRWGCCCSA